MKVFLTALSVVVALSSAGHAALVWESTFDADADGVVDLRTDNLGGTVMIGANTGGALPINTQSLGVTLSNKSGRDTGGTLGHTDSFSALYTFTWSLGALAPNTPAGYFAGFTSASSQHSTRQFLGTRFIRQVTANGDHLVNLGGAWGSEGFTGTGRNFAGDVNLGPNLDGRPLHLAVGYNGSSHILDVKLYDGITGAPIVQSTGDIRTFDNLGVPQGHPSLNNELNALAVTHAGWTDFIDVTDNIDTIWNMNSLRYYDDPTGAFDDVETGALVNQPWAGQGQYRMQVRVDPINIGARPSDERPAQLSIDLKNELQNQLGVNGIVDMNSVQVIRYDPNTGLAIKDGNWALGKDIADRAFRWYDDDIPYEYPEVETNIHAANGVLNYVNRTRFGYFYDAEGDWESGKLAWTHTQEGDESSYYAVYFDVLPDGTEPWVASPRGLLGDGGMRTELLGHGTTGTIHTRIDVTDWDGDGLEDIIAGNSRGGIAWYKNTGTAQSPEFGTSKILFTTDGKPIDVSWSSTPKVTDWDGDGVEDIITAGERNRMLWYKNVGTNTDRQFEYKGFIMEGGGPLILPVTPNPEIPTITLDYYAVTDVLDFDGDGDEDLIAGGYITGRLFFYENTGQNPDGTPQLSFQGAINADGVPLDTSWSAAPTFADFTNDGLKDIVVGTFPLTPGGGDATSSEDFLRFYENVGTPTNPVYEQRTMPITGGVFPDTHSGTPRAVDFNDDGLLDLIVSENTRIYQYENVGTQTDPLFAAHTNAMPGEWGSAPLGASQMIDWDGDGLLDLFQGYVVGLNAGQGNPGVFQSQSSVLPPGVVIDHLSGIGDDHRWQRVFDLDENGVIDFIDADHDGKIWFHRNTGTTASPIVDETGVVLMRNDGNPIDVGPGPGADPFDLLQGSRATYAIADFNKDGLGDIAIANFDGIVRYYDNDPSLADTVFDLPDVVGDLGIRAVPYAADWDNDGWIDIIAQARPEEFVFIRNLGVDGNGDAVFAPGIIVPLPPAPYGAGGDIVVADYNHDGDDDILMQTAFGYTVLTDGSFLQNGYASAVVLGFEEFMSILLGDANNDGQVTGADLIAVQQNFGNTGPTDGMLLGDANDDGQVTGADLIAVQQNFGNVLGPGSGRVPEPASAALLGMGALAVLARRRCDGSSRRYRS